MTLSKKSLIASLVVAVIGLSALGMYSITTPSLLNGYHTDLIDAQGVRHVSFGDPSQDNIAYHGVVHYVGKHADGTVFLIADVHNTRTVQGINCAEQFLFNGLSTGPLNTNGTNVCGFQGNQNINSAKFNGFRFIGLMNQTSGGSITVNGSDTVATSKIGGTRVQGNHGIIFTANQGLPVNSTVVGTSTYNKITITSSAIPFTGIGPSGTNICGAVLLNSTSTTANAMFAENTFSCITLANADTLTITWTITLS